MLDVEVPAVYPQLSSPRHWLEVVPGEGVYTALLPGLQNGVEEDETTQTGTGTIKRTIVAGKHFQLTVPSAWRTRDLSGEDTEYVRFTFSQLSVWILLAQRCSSLTASGYQPLSLTFEMHLYMNDQIGEEVFRKSLARARLLQPGPIGSVFTIPASVFGVDCGGNVWGESHIKHSHLPPGKD